MWHIWVSDIRKGKVIYEVNCHTTHDMSHFQGKCFNGAAIGAMLMAADVKMDKVKEFINRYLCVSDEVFYVDVQTLIVESK